MLTSSAGIRRWTSGSSAGNWYLGSLGAGRVPTCSSPIASALAVLIVDGEELIGARQNRVVNLTILVAASSKMTIRTSCVEAGRWSTRSRVLVGAANAVRQRTHEADAAGHRFDARERRATLGSAEVWADIAENRRPEREVGDVRHGALYTGHAVSVDEFVSACRPTEDQIGAVFAIDGRISGLEIFDSPATLRTLLPKIVRGYAIDAIDRRLADGVASAASSVRPQAERFVAAVTACGSVLPRPPPVWGPTCGCPVPASPAPRLATDHVLHLIAFAV